MEFNVGKRITFYRQQQGITVNRLATLAGISQSYLRDIELGKKQPTVEYLSYICDALDITLCDFFNDDKSSDELFTALCALKPKQKKALYEFLQTLK